jgi:hypothetical protein
MEMAVLAQRSQDTGSACTDGNGCAGPEESGYWLCLFRWKWLCCPRGVRILALLVKMSLISKLIAGRYLHNYFSVFYFYYKSHLNKNSTLSVCNSIYIFLFKSDSKK